MTQPSQFPNFDVKEFLRPLLFGLPEEDLDLLAETSTMQTYPRGTAIVREGEYGDIVYVVYKGRVDIHKRVDDETQRLLHSGGPGEFFGEIAVLRQGTRTATVRAATDTTVIEIGEQAFFEVLGRSPTLAIRFLMHITQRLRDSDEQAIQELQASNLELSVALRRLERLDQRKSDFIQVSAHELRTPLAALLGYTQMMEKTPTVQSNPEVSVLMDGILTSTKRLHRVFNSILDASRVMNDELRVYRSPVSVPAVFHSILSEVDETLEERHLTVEMSGLQGLPFLSAAPDLLTKAFQYLLNNAIKYTPDRGQIMCECQLLTSSETAEEMWPGSSDLAGDRWAAFRVADTGVGISQEDLPHLYERFYRVKSESSIPGTGLGLSISQQLVDLHKGHIAAASTLGKGSTFAVYLPPMED